ncbi:class I SAM-dependent methyltransferase [bacterium]|nr:class I SAM-dependent methyltransferase [bacterium]MCI0612446.1 class I SAM-dependent methyltransferase [bacterium]
MTAETMDRYFQTRLTFDKGRTKVWKAICEYLQSEINENSAVLDLGCGYCDFINQISASKKYAVDSNPESKQYCAKDVEFLQANVTSLGLETNSIDVVFASNLLEHFNNDELQQVFSEINRVLKKHGKLILIQPNYYYAYREYWDDYTHVKAFTHTSLVDFLTSKNYAVTKVVKRFLPFSFHSILPKTYVLTKIYLALPYHFGAKQMLVIASKAD